MESEENKMTTNSRSRGSERSHNRRKDAKANGMRMSQEEIDEEIAEIKRKLDVLMMILEESQRQGWVLRNKLVKWHKL